MTAEGAPTLRTPPRLFVRTAWVLHRALLRFSGRRIGLSRPEAGQRFGMMRLTTVGRRTGQPRVAIVGYYDDGENLVTLAMNNLDSARAAEVLGLLRTFNRERGQTVLLVTHDAEVSAACDRIIRMRDGLIVGDERTAPVIEAAA
jgi:hypothetical protein